MQIKLAEKNFKIHQKIQLIVRNIPISTIIFNDCEFKVPGYPTKKVGIVVDFYILALFPYYCINFNYSDYICFGSFWVPCYFKLQTRNLYTSRYYG